MARNKNPWSSATPSSATTRMLLLFAAAAAAAAASSQAAHPRAQGTAVSGLPRGFRGVELGMNLQEVENALRNDELFLFRGGPDLTLLPRPEEKILEVQGLSFVKRAFFQFHEDRLFSAIYVINPEKMDHFSVFTRFSDRYGKPSSLSPRVSIWTDGIVSVSLERPLTVKYLDVVVLEELRRAGEVRQSWEDLSRQDFLDSF
ncbi:MAG TPA: hypothetical protein VLH39_06745 [Magnetospirillaceae bacterium]|nr:hypothetical protein [Magnetospirillaceae bacterium]